MHAGMIYIRVAVTLLVIIMCSAKFPPNRRHKQSPVYPLEVHQMFRERLSKSDKPRTEGIWSPWSSWSPCSRSCGGGVTQQIRHCVPKSSPYSSGRENQRRRRRKRKLGNHCIGLYKRFHLCNTQKCPSGRDFRTEQCSYFNKNPFKGKYYYWEPFLQAGDECSLNCRPVGMRFFATLNKTVVDGTPCFHPLTATGKAAPPGNPGVCIDGRCKSVASNGVIGSVDETPEECAACLKGSCRSVSGLYTKPDLSPGYSLVAQIPQGACRILVQQLKHTKNLIALRNANGSFIINGDWKFSPSRTVEGAGTRFIYRKQDATTLETISSAGPLSNPVDIMILYQQPNLGVKYGYAMPMEQPSTEQIAPPYIKRPANPVGLEPRRLDPPSNSVTQRDEARPPTHTYRRRIRRRFSWKISGVSACSKSCGGGMQTTIFSCVREHTQTTVPDKRCTHLDRPLPQQIRCNIQACPPYWGGVWGPCTGSCGQGVQNFILQCQQDSGSGQTLVVNDAACVRPKPIASSRPCRLGPCENESDNELHQNPDADNMVEVQEWKVGPWSQCSVSCGTGQRTRMVSCLSGRCPPEKRPPHAEYCDSGSCAIQGQISHWLVSEWSQCSEACGTGTQTRLTACGNGDSCESSAKPEVERACSSDRYCVGQWFVGPWSICSDSCNGSSKQVREVMCIVKIRGQSRITNEMTCSTQDKPPTERLCQGSCLPRWFVGEWNICECPSGTQRREVKCLDRSGALSNQCSDTERPVIKRPCSCEKREDHMNKLAHDEPQDHNCVDKFSNCYLAVQARLCQYSYYINNCCVSCRKAPQDAKQ